MFFLMTPETRPDMFVPRSKKDREYRRRRSRSNLACLNTGPILRMHAKSRAAMKVYNDEVLTDEDIDTFILDESGNPRNRVMYGFNMVKPIIEQHRGTAIQSQYSASVQPVTQNARTARQVALAKEVLAHGLAEISPQMRRILSANHNLGRTMQETLDLNDQLYRDPHVKAMNLLLQRSADMCDFNRFEGDSAMRFAFTGMEVEIYRDGQRFIRRERVHPHDFFWDTSAREPDLSDASHMGICPFMTVPRIAEEWRVDREQLKHIEAMIRTYAGLPWTASSFRAYDIWSQDKVRVWSDFWIDEQEEVYGYIEGPGLVPTLVCVGEKDDSGREYKEADLIGPPETARNKEIFAGDKTAKLTVESVNYCTFVPWEYMAGCDSSKYSNKHYQEGRLTDLVLDDGVYGLQEYIAIEPQRARMPIKVTTFANVDGEIVSPVQAVLSPNKFVNRVLSSTESLMNASGGKVPLVDMDLVDPALDEVEVDIRRKQGRTIPLRAGGRGVSNAIGSHDDSPGSGVYAGMQVVQQVQDMMRTVTGVHQPMTGEQEKGQLVKVTEILVQRGALMQEAFHDARADLKLQGYRFLATAGKEFYLENWDVLVDLIPEEDILYLFQTRRMEVECFNASVQRDNPERTKRQLANSWLDQLVQFGFVDRGSYVQLYNTSTMDDVLDYLKRRNAELQQAEAQAQRDQVKQQMEAGLAAKEEDLKMRERELQDKQIETAQMMAKEGAKEHQKVTQERMRQEAERERAQQEQARAAMQAVGANP